MRFEDNDFETWGPYFIRISLVPLMRPIAIATVNELHEEISNELKGTNAFHYDNEVIDEFKSRKKMQVTKPKKGRHPIDPIIALELIRILEWGKSNRERLDQIHEFLSNELKYIGPNEKGVPEKSYFFVRSKDEEQPTQWAATWKAALFIRLCKHYGVEPTSSLKEAFLERVKAMPWPQKEDGPEKANQLLEKFFDK